VVIEFDFKGIKGIWNYGEEDTQEDEGQVFD
jgi:hypothetical protein